MNASKLLIGLTKKDFVVFLKQCFKFITKHSIFGVIWLVFQFFSSLGCLFILIIQINLNLRLTIWHNFNLKCQTWVTKNWLTQNWANWMKLLQLLDKIHYGHTQGITFWVEFNFRFLTFNIHKALWRLLTLWATWLWKMLTST